MPKVSLEVFQCFLCLRAKLSSIVDSVQQEPMMARYILPTANHVTKHVRLVIFFADSKLERMQKEGKTDGDFNLVVGQIRDRIMAHAEYDEVRGLIEAIRLKNPHFDWGVIAESLPKTLQEMRQRPKIAVRPLPIDEKKFLRALRIAKTDDEA